MSAWLQSLVHALLAAFALPQVGLPAVFLVSLLSATLLPLGSVPVVFAYVSLRPEMFWAAVLTATLGNTLGGLISYAMGAGAARLWHDWRQRSAPRHPPRRRGAARWHALATRWSQRLGPPVLLLSWLPLVGDPLCAVAGWMRLPPLPCAIYMAIGKLLRYVVLTAALVHARTWLGPL